MKTLVNAALSLGLKSDYTSIEKINTGHINRTYRIIYSKNESYILQELNKNAFKNPDKVMSNIDKLCRVLKNEDSNKFTFPEYLKCENKNYVKLCDSVWRGYRYIGNSVSYESFDDIKLLYGFGRTLGNFHKLTELADISDFNVTVADFHNTLLKLKKLDLLMNEKNTKEFEFFKDMKNYAKQLKLKKLPFKVTHNDVKCSNTLFDENSGKCITLIDFDTVMPGLRVYDFGDGARSGCITDNKIDLNKFDEYCKGYFSVISDGEPDDYFFGMICITAELSARYCIDYLSNENYFHDKTPQQKFKRCSELIETARSIEFNRQEIENIIKKYN
jgi:thiamine kinase-like enzyme